MLIPYKNAVLSITSDNGGEFAEHKTISKKLKTDFFFANPYASWERGLSEGFLWKTNIPIPKESSEGVPRTFGINLLDNISLCQRHPFPMPKASLWGRDAFGMGKELNFKILQINKSHKYNIKSTEDQEKN